MGPEPTQGLEHRVGVIDVCSSLAEEFPIALEKMLDAIGFVTERIDKSDEYTLKYRGRSPRFRVMEPDEGCPPKYVVWCTDNGHGELISVDVQEQ